MHDDGAICHLWTRGTELEKFSLKGRRVVLLAAQDGEVGWVYPLTSKAGAGRTVIDRASGRSYLLVEHGLFRVSLKDLVGTGERFGHLPRLHARIRRDLAAREERSLLGEGGSPLTQRIRVPPLPDPPEPPPPRIEEEFEAYLRADLDEDIRQGRHLPDE